MIEVIIQLKDELSSPTQAAAQTLSGFKSGITGAGEEAATATSHFATFGSALADVAKTAAGFVAGQALISFTHDLSAQFEEVITGTEKFGETVRVLAQDLGITAPQASVLATAFNELNISVGSTTSIAGGALRGMIQFARGIGGVQDSLDGMGSASKTVSQTLKDLGIGVTNTDGTLRDAYSVLTDVADKFAAMPDGLLKTTEASALFGSRLGTEMIPLLNLGSAGLAEVAANAQKFGLILSGDTVQSIRDFTLAHKELNAAIEGARLSLGVALMPVLTDLTLHMTDGVVQVIAFGKSFAFQQDVQAVGAALGALKDTTASIVGWFRQAWDMTDGFRTSLVNIQPGVRTTSDEIATLAGLAEKGAAAFIAYDAAVTAAALVTKGFAAALAIGPVFAGVGAAVAALTVGIGLFAEGEKAAAVATLLLDAAMDANPVGLFAAALVAAGAALLGLAKLTQAAYDHIQGFHDGVDAAHGVVTTLWNDLQANPFGLVETAITAVLTPLRLLADGLLALISLVPGMGDKVDALKATLSGWGQEVEDAANNKLKALGSAIDTTSVSILAGAAAISAHRDQVNGLTVDYHTLSQEMFGVKAATDAATTATDALNTALAANKAATTAAIAEAKAYLTNVKDIGLGAAQAQRDIANQANQQTLDATKAEIAAEKTAYDDRMNQDVKDRQAQTVAALASLAAQKSATDAADVAAQHQADVSDTAWKRQVTQIKDAATAGENALHTSNDAILTNAVATANASYTAEITAIDAEVKAREEADAREIHDQELKTAANIAQIDKEKLAAIAAIDAQLAATIAGYANKLSAEKQANADRLAVEAMTKSQGAAAGAQLSLYFGATEAQAADLQAAVDAKKAGNDALAQQDMAAADRQAAIAKALAEQLGAINQTVYDQMAAYQIQSDTLMEQAQVQLATDQANQQKASTTTFYDDQKAQQQQALADYKWTMSQNLQAFKDAEDAKKAADKTTLTQLLDSYAKQQTAENTRHTDVLAHVTQQALVDTQAIDALATKRKADDAAQTAQRLAAYNDAVAKANSSSANDIAKMQATKAAGDVVFGARTTAAENYYKAVQTAIGNTFTADTAAINGAATANTAALLIMTNDTKTYADAATTSLAGVLASVEAIRAAESGTPTHAPGKGPATGGGQGPAITGGGSPVGDGHNTARGAAAWQTAMSELGSGAYYQNGNTYCETFAEDVTGIGWMGGSAQEAWSNWGNAEMPGQLAPGYSLVYFSGPSSAGHVGISDGSGDFISVLDPPWNITKESIGSFTAENPGSYFLGSVPLYAAGTAYHPGGFAIVGERGPELVNLPTGSSVTPNSSLGAAIDYERLATAIAAQPITVQVDGQQLATVVRNQLLRMKRSMPSLGLS